jgi:hypothetical protein
MGISITPCFLLTLDPEVVINGTGLAVTPTFPPRGVAPVARKRKQNAKKFFWKDVYIGSIPPIISQMQSAYADMKASDLQMLDQQTMSQEAFINATWIYINGLVKTKGVGWLERELEQAFAEMSRLVAAEARLREAIEEPPDDLPDGFSTPEERQKDQKPDRKNSRRKT